MTLEQDALPTPPRAKLISRANHARALGIAAVYLLLGGLTLSPLLAARIPALVDYPNHLARMWILAHGQDIPELASNYIAHWRLLPDLAMDLIVPPLAHLIGIEHAGRVFIALTMVLLVTGTVILHRVLHGRIGLWPLCSLLFVYNAVLYWGFLNCLFGMGIGLLLFAAWIATRSRPGALRVPIFALAASVVFCLHLFAFGFYGLLIASYEAANFWPMRAWSLPRLTVFCSAVSQFVPGLLLWWASLGNGGPSLTLYGSLPAKAYAAFAPVTFGSVPLPFDGLLLFFCAGAWFVARIGRSVIVASDMKLPLAAALGVAVLMPHWVSGSAFADIRLPAILPFLLIASTRLEAPRLRLVAPFAVAALAFLTLRVWTVSQTWRAYDAQFAEFRAADYVVAPGARLLVVANPIPRNESSLSGLPRALATKQDNNFNHMATLAIIDRSAFVPFLFTGWTSVSPTPRNAGLYVSSGSPLTPEQLATSESMDQPDSPYVKPDLLGELPYWRNWRQHFDYLLWIGFNESEPPADPALAPVARGSFFVIDRIHTP